MKLDALGAHLGIPDLEDHVLDVDRELFQSLAADISYLRDPALRVATGPGKRLRPVLTIAAATLGNVGFNQAIRSGAIAVELVHAGSLVHDDIIDSAYTRRGVVTVNKQEGDNRAILVGDYMLARAGVAAASVSKEVAGELARTIADLCDGQSREMADQYQVDRTEDSYLAAIRGKTAALLRSSCTIGGLCAELPADTVEALRAYGTAFGMAFQIIDDVLDIVSTEERLRKPVGNDVREGVYTLPILHALTQPGGDELRAMLGGPIEDPTLVDRALEIIKSGSAIKSALAVVGAYNASAADALMAVGPSSRINGLATLPEEYLRWALDTKAPDFASYASA